MLKTSQGTDIQITGFIGASRMRKKRKKAEAVISVDQPPILRSLGNDMSIKRVQEIGLS
jgi:hypothetical protein